MSRWASVFTCAGIVVENLRLPPPPPKLGLSLEKASASYLGVQGSACVCVLSSLASSDPFNFSKLSLARGAALPGSPVSRLSSLLGLPFPSAFP